MRTIEKPIAKQKIDLESQSARDHVTRCHLMADVQRLQTNPRKRINQDLCKEYEFFYDQFKQTFVFR